MQRGPPRLAALSHSIVLEVLPSTLYHSRQRAGYLRRSRLDGSGRSAQSELRRLATRPRKVYPAITVRFNVVCISHTDGAGGDGIGHAVAERLGLRYVNEEIILEAARLARVDPAVVAATEQKQSFLSRLLDSIAAAQEAIGPAALAGFAVATAPEIGTLRTDKEDLRSLIRAAIHEVAGDGNAVIVAHAASLALAGKPGVLRVLVTAPDDIRRRRIAAERSLSDADAEDAISKGDSARREYIRRFYDVDRELPTHYDLVLNTEVLTPVQATSLIVAAASS